MSNAELEGGRFLPLVEDFYTLQGEGFHTGRAAYFIRLGGCDVGCRWCDAKDTWNPKVHPPVAVDDIVRRASAWPAKAVVVTGGEPLIYPLGPLCRELHAAGVEIFLETSGSHPFSGEFDWVCLSPKKRLPPLDEAWGRADELKVIIETADDLRWAEECAAKVADGFSRRFKENSAEFIAVGFNRRKAEECMLFLQPEWSRRDAVMPAIVEYIKENPRWRISLQSHKYMRIP